MGFCLKGVLSREDFLSEGVMPRGGLCPVTQSNHELVFFSRVSVMAGTIKENFSQMSEHFCCGQLRHLVLM